MIVTAISVNALNLCGGVSKFHEFLQKVDNVCSEKQGATIKTTEDEVISVAISRTTKFFDRDKRPLPGETQLQSLRGIKVRCILGCTLECINANHGNMWFCKQIKCYF